MHLTEKEMEIFNKHYLIIESKSSVTVQSELHGRELVTDINDLEALDEVSLDPYFEDTSMSDSTFSIIDKESGCEVRGDIDHGDMDAVKRFIQDLINTAVSHSATHATEVF